MVMHSNYCTPSWPHASREPLFPLVRYPARQKWLPSWLPGLKIERDENDPTAETRTYLLAKIWDIKQSPVVKYPSDAAFARFHRIHPWSPVG